MEEEEAAPFYHEEAEEENDGEGNPGGQKDDEAEEAPAKKSATVKRIVRNPQPKLNADRLRGPKGIPELLRMSKNMKFKRKGHEREDLNLIMNTLKHWAHRLFPKFMSNEFFERVERLGTKKTIQGYVRRVRMGLEDVTAVPKSFDIVASDDEDDVERGLDEHHREVPREDLFDNLLGTTVEDANSESLSSLSVTSQPVKPPVVFDKDAKARAERNRQLAIERRLKRLAEGSKSSTATDTFETSLYSASASQSNCDGGNLLQGPKECVQGHSSSLNSEDGEQSMEAIRSGTLNKGTQGYVDALEEDACVAASGEISANHVIHHLPNNTDTACNKSEVCENWSGGATDSGPACIRMSDSAAIAEANNSAAQACQNSEKMYDASEPLFDSPMETT